VCVVNRCFKGLYARVPPNIPEIASVSVTDPIEKVFDDVFLNDPLLARKRSAFIHKRNPFCRVPLDIKIVWPVGFVGSTEDLKDGAEDGLLTLASHP
jgi:hypothetical protein